MKQRYRRTLHGSSMVALLMFAGSVQFAHAAPTIAPGTPRACIGLDAYHTTSAVRSLCHVQAAPLLAVSERSDGGHEYHYDVDGVQTSLPFPPANLHLRGLPVDPGRATYGGSNSPTNPASSRAHATTIFWPGLCRGAIPLPSGSWTLGFGT